MTLYRPHCYVHHLLAFNGQNPHSVVVLDNCAIHHVEQTIRMIQEVGALVHFLPPYSPDLNPMEEAFSKVKVTLKLLEKETDMGEDQETLVRTTSILIHNKGGLREMDRPCTK